MKLDVHDIISTGILIMGKQSSEALQSHRSGPPTSYVLYVEMVIMP